jgi:3-deoxy-D-manno-octulosonic-acid transferase
VGESLALLGLIGDLRETRPGLGLLLTTGTRTSADLMATRLPEGVIHQYVPLDVGPWRRRFLAHWRPDVAVWAESELWPGLIEATAARCPLLLVNARLSARSAARWGRAPGIARRLLSRFDAILAQDGASVARFEALGAPRVRLAGSLKAGGAPPDLPEARAALARAAAGRPVWLAASTHEGEEASVAEAHRVATRAVPGLLTLLAPRHPERGPSVAAALEAAGLAVTRRSLDQQPGPETAVHVLDTLGEMGAWLRLSPVCFLGGSLVEVGGHNPYEPAALGAAILHGPHVANFEEEYARLGPAAPEVAGGGALGAAVARWLTDAPACVAAAEAAEAALGAAGDARAAALMAVLERLPEGAGAC